MSNKTIRIFRISDEEKELTGYVKISNNINPKTLTMQELGLMLYLLSKPNDWKLIVKAIAKEFKMTSKTIYKIVNKLIDKGYILRSYALGYAEYEIYERPLKKKV